jgi:hypothetical protein
MADPKRPRGRPPSPQGARPRAENQRDHRGRRTGAGKVLRVIDTWTTMTPAEIAELRERLGNALRELELRRQDVARIEARTSFVSRSDHSAASGSRGAAGARLTAASFETRPT